MISMIDALWLLSDHVCRFCLGRVLEGDGDTFRCADCGVEGKGRPDEVCGCGLQLGEGRLATRRLFRCAPNPNPSATCRSEIVIAFGDPPQAPARADVARQLAPVEADDGR
jgi:hypothetical protein